MTTRYRLHVLVVVIVLGILGNTTWAAERPAVRTMAEILLTFNHAPSPIDREALKEILHDEAATACERVIARALLNVQHIASAEDERTLEAVITDQSVPRSLRTLATVVVNLTHTITNADRRALEALLEQTHRLRVPSDSSSARRLSTPYQSSNAASAPLASGFCGAMEHGQ